MQLDSARVTKSGDARRAGGKEDGWRLLDKRERTELLAELFVPKSPGCVSSAIPDPGLSQAKLQRRDLFAFSIDMRHRDAPMRSSEYCATLSRIIRDACRVPDIILARLIVKNRSESSRVAFPTLTPPLHREIALKLIIIAKEKKINFIVWPFKVLQKQKHLHELNKDEALINNMKIIIHLNVWKRM